MKHILILLTLFITSAFAQQKFINVNGTSEVVRNADQINFSIQIKNISETVEKSKSLTDENTSSLIALLNEHGISSDDIEVSPIKLGKNYEYNDGSRQRVHKGYFTHVDVSFLLKDISKYYALSNDIAKSDAYEIVSANYNISDYEAQHKAAYEQALKAAKEKALYMCTTLGVKLSSVIEIEENDQWQSVLSPMNTATFEGSQTGNPSGKVTIRRSVHVKFGIE
ncbi:MAG: SIMPL domain-containing protein [Ignavibacteriales bacterium]|nr:MAG: SIMPL domain-containing protein [Ignavibacteriales bacterium]